MIVVIFAAAPFTTGVIIECNFKNEGWDLETDQYTCSDTIITTDRNMTHVVDVTGNHLSEKTNAEVTAFYIYTSHKRWKRILKGMDKFFPKLIALAWQGGSLTTLTAEDLEQFPNLQQFNAYNNKLVSLDGGLFKHTPKLRRINFRSNLLEHVGIGLLDNLTHLTVSDFENNPCIDIDAYTQKAIQELKLILQNQCPPLETTTTSTTTSSTSTTFIPTIEISTSSDSRQCSIECVELIETLKKEVKIQSEKNEKTSEEIARQDVKITAQADSIKELEKQMREIRARP